MSAEDLLTAALQLPAEDREYLSQRLADSLAPEEEPIGDALAAEFSRRAQAVQAGTATIIPADRAFKDAYQSLTRLRQH